MTMQARTSRRSSAEKERALQRVVAEKTKKLTCEIPETLHRRIKARAAEEGRTMADVVIAAAEEYLTRG